MRITTITITINDIQVVSSLSLSIEPGQTHVIMGPNGSGKSSFAYALAGYPAYKITHGSLIFEEKDITSFSIEERAKAGIFLAHQQPVSIPGVSVRTLIAESWRALGKPAISAQDLQDRIMGACKQVGLDNSFIDRSINEGFSGGEKKRLELMQALVLEPKLLILDEIDSGLDVDALALVGAALRTFKQEHPAASIIIITHYQRLLQHVACDAVHIVQSGQLIASGGQELIDTIETYGYDKEKLRTCAV
jgi:Fe-S cluster assembly ATP-binding protein